MKEFSAYDCALDGINLIEAGAGTGKTYNIQTLTARIVLEKAIPVTRILVVTYTRAATAELRERLRKVLDSLLRMLEGVPVPDGEEERCRTILDNLRKLPEDAPFWTMQIEGIKPRSPEETFLRNAKLLLQNALRDFDQAAISTIHSFCQRMLTENAFESGIRYGIELVSDTSAVTDALIQQFIRREFYACTPEETAVWESLAIVWQKTGSSDGFSRRRPSFMEQLQSAMRDNDIDYFWGESNTPGTLFIPPERKKLLAEIAACRQSLASERASIEELEETLKPHLKKPFEETWKQNREALLSGNGPLELSFLEQLNFDSLRKQAYKRRTGEKLPISDEALKECLDKPFFATVGHLVRLLQDYRSRVYYDGLEFVKKELEERKSRDGFMTFNDLLNELEKRLRDPQRGPMLKQLIRKQFPFALVDEFQDTDGVQFSIFHSIFADASAQEASGFFLIGDPKQSIYRFRGGDIFTYLRARSQVPLERRFTLTANYRSSRPFIEELNRFYRFNQPYPFAHPELEIPEVVCPGKTKEVMGQSSVVRGAGCGVRVRHGGQDKVHPTTIRASQPERLRHFLNLHPLHPFPTHHAPRTTHPIPIPPVLQKTEALPKETLLLDGKEYSKPLEFVLATGPKAQYYRSVADEIKAMVQSGRWSIGLEGGPNRALEYGDFAVLFRGNAHAREMEAILRRMGVPAVRIGTSNVLASAAAETMQIFLEALLEPGETRGLIQLLASPLHRKSAVELYDMRTSGVLLHFQTWISELADDWKNKSFLPMVMEYLSDDKRQVMLHLLAGEEGERTLMDFLHLAEILSKAESELKLTREGLFQHFLRLQQNPQDDDENMIRLANARDAVILATVHYSKGLEYPLVFLPDIHEKGGQYEPVCHYDCNGTARMLKDITGLGLQPEKCALEAMQERLRLFYVAITRAKFFCKAWVETGGNSAFNYLFRERDQEQFPEPLEDSLAKRVSSLGNIQSLEDLCRAGVQIELQRIETEEAEETAAIEVPEEALPEPELQNLAHPERIRPFWHTLSASVLMQRLLQNSTAQTPYEVAATKDLDEADAADLEHVGAQLSPEEWTALPPIFTFNPGKQTGTCWHAIFENLDFNASLEEIRRVCAEQLDLYSLSGTPNALETVSGMVENVLQATLTPTPGFGAPFRLCEISSTERLSELEFTYGLPVGQKKLRLEEDFLRRHGLPDQQAFSSGIARAMNGSIDLLLRNNQRFYIIDWKSNVINYQLENFSGEGLQAEMRQHAYPLQYLVYTCALVEFLRQRLGHFGAEEYEKLFGGVFYLFLRGIDPSAPGRGIVSVRPQYQDIETLLGMIGNNNIF